MKFPFDSVDPCLALDVCSGSSRTLRAFLWPRYLPGDCGDSVRRRSGGETPAASSGPALIQLDGSSTVFPISEAVAEEFQKANPNVRVTVGISGTGGGFQKFCRGETDISDASRPISAPRSRPARRPASSTSSCPIAYDGLAVVVNPKNTWATSITVAELKKLWAPEAQGKIMRLEPGADGMARPRDSPVRRRRRFGHLRLLHRSDRREAGRQPRRLHLERGRQRAGPGRQQRRTGARIPAAGLRRAEQGRAEDRAGRRWQGGERRRSDRADRRDRAQRHLSAAVASALHLRRAQGGRPPGGPALRRIVFHRRGAAA